MTLRKAILLEDMQLVQSYINRRNTVCVSSGDPLMGFGRKVMLVVCDVSDIFEYLGK